MTSYPGEYYFALRVRMLRAADTALESPHLFKLRDFVNIISFRVVWTYLTRTTVPGKYSYQDLDDL